MRVLEVCGEGDLALEAGRADLAGQLGRQHLDHDPAVE